MKTFLKYLSLVALALVLTVSTFSTSSSAASKKKQTEGEGYLTPEQVVEMNAALQILKDQANEKLAAGEENFTVSTEVSYSEEPVTMTFESNQTNQTRSLALATQEKSYSATVSNTNGFNFSHRLYGSFVWGSGKVNTYTKYAALEGPTYYKTHVTTATRLDPSVVEVHSEGNFEAFRYFTEYKTAITIRLLGSGTYTVTEARIIDPY